MSDTHTYESRLSWEGSTAVGYEAYDRTHRIRVPPADVELVLSSDPAFIGDPRLANPEQLLLAAASSCQLLTFLAIAARSRIAVLAYQDAAEATMPEDAEPMRITRIALRPRITIASDGDVDRVRRLVKRAHDRCFIANTLNAEITVDALVERADAATPGTSESRTPTPRPGT